MTRSKLCSLSFVFVGLKFRLPTNVIEKNAVSAARTDDQRGVMDEVAEKKRGVNERSRKRRDRKREKRARKTGTMD